MRTVTCAAAALDCWCLIGSQARARPLSFLGLQGNKIEYLSQACTDLPEGLDLQLWDNPLFVPPLDIAEQGLARIQQWFIDRQQRRAVDGTCHEETCQQCKARIVGVRHHRRGTFTDLCSAHFAELAEAERAAYNAIERTPPCRL